MKILAIETSCDETAIALLECTGDLEEPRFKLMANALVSQIDVHKEFGGVVPMLAKREHEKNLPILLNKVFKDACFDLARPNIDIIAVTAGPGLEPALWAGINFAEELGKKWNIPVQAVNHMKGHIYSVLYQSGILDGRSLEFPALALLVSGGHTEIVQMAKIGHYEVIGCTRDDAVGEAFDKVARILGLSYPGGPEVARLAAEARKKGWNEFHFPMPMLHSHDLDFSYSGLKTAVLYAVKKVGALTDQQKADIARAFEDAAIGILIEKTRLALESYEAKTLIVGGGVSANSYLNQGLGQLLKSFPAVSLHFPDHSLTTDNAVMIGIAAYIDTFTGNKPSTDIKASGNLSY